jgi:secondary thiamine-phosphate synthase enzyme
MTMETTVMPRQACFHSFAISLRTQHARQFIDITDDILDRLQDSGIENGLAVVTSQHTTASIVVNEHEPELLKDLNGFLQRLAPEAGHYDHNAAPCGPEEQPNGHSHCQALLLNTSASFPIADGQAVLGRYQRVFLVELDCARPRTVRVAFLGA